jgi:outer membrane murein-binding lipoprotein Lpp
MTDTKPKLVAVGSAQDKATSDPAPQRRRRWTDLGIGFWLLAVILVVAVVIIAFQARQLDQLSVQVETLETEVETLETELSAARGALRGYENRFGEIRESVGDLRAQLGELEGLVERPPAPAPDR